MRFIRQMLTAAVLAAYLAQSLCGQVVHLWECGDSCCIYELAHQHGSPKPSVSCSDTWRTQHTQHSHSERSHCECSEAGFAAGYSSKQSSDEAPRHDSSNCAVCQVLAQAHKAPVPFLVVHLGQVQVAAQGFFPEVYRSPAPRGFNPRAPPAA